MDDEVVRVPPHCHGFLSALVSTATWTEPGVVFIQHLTETVTKKRVVTTATQTPPEAVLKQRLTETIKKKVWLP